MPIQVVDALAIDNDFGPLLAASIQGGADPVAGALQMNSVNQQTSLRGHGLQAKVQTQGDPLGAAGCNSDTRRVRSPR